MKYLLKDLNVIRNIISNQRVALFLDYDGTLTPIAQSPDKAIISKEVKDILEALSKMPQFQLAIISGRALEDIRNLVGLQDIIYVGNHGFEIKELGMEFTAAMPLAYKTLLEHFKKEINNKLADFPGAFIEDKGVTISVHYRQINPEQGIILEHLLYGMTESHLAKDELSISLGKKAFEIKPSLEWDKGKAVLRILENQKSYPIYIGDDTTDEDAFLAIKDIGITICVGGKESSHAQYYLNNTDDVVLFLKYLCEGK